MKNILVLSITILNLSLFGLMGGAAQAANVEICHVPGGNPDNAHSITIAEAALNAHLGENEEGLHGGDAYGQCVSSELDPCDDETNLAICADDGIYF